MLAVLHPKLSEPALNLGRGPSLAEQLPQRIPLLLGELGFHSLFAEQEVDARTAFLLRGRGHEMPAVPGTLYRPALDHGVKFGKVGIAANQEAHTAAVA